MSGLADPKQKLRIGPSVCWVLEKDGKAGMVEFSGAGMGAIRETMARRVVQPMFQVGRVRDVGERQRHEVFQWWAVHVGTQPPRPDDDQREERQRRPASRRHDPLVEPQPRNARPAARGDWSRRRP